MPVGTPAGCAGRPRRSSCGGRAGSLWVCCRGTHLRSTEPRKRHDTGKNRRAEQALGSEGDTVNLKREYFVLLIFITHVRNQPQLAVRHDFLLGGSRTNGSASLSFCRLLLPFLLSEFPKQVSAASEEGGCLHPCRLQPRCGPARGTKRLTETEPSASLQDSQAHRLIPWEFHRMCQKQTEDLDAKIRSGQSKTITSRQELCLSLLCNDIGTGSGHQIFWQSPGKWEKAKITLIDGELVL